MKVKRIGFLGLTFTDPNKGCEALTFTFLNMLKEFYEGQKLHIICFMRSDEMGKIPEFFPEFEFECHILNIYNPSSWISVFRDINTCDCVFDGSYGDGFTGIYGTRRNFVQCLRKQMVLSAHKPLYLLPQTYGSYKFPFRNWSVRLIKDATLAYARDEQTAREIGSFVKTTSDMAFGLPFDRSVFALGNMHKFGVNLSSLLWDDGTRGRFGLTVDYKQFYREFISFLLNETDYQVHLIPHVIDDKNYDAPENDYRVCMELEKEFKGKVIVAPAFETAIEAKSYISNMDIFLGSRMHSTIGAISSGVATIPFSYAYKFETLYTGIGYPYVIHATKETTEEALKHAKEWVRSADKLRESGTAAVSKALEKLEEFKTDLRDSLEHQKLL